MPTPRERDPRYFILETVATPDDKQITGSRLPTVKQVLLCFLAHHAEAGVTIRDAANATVETVQPFYSRARVPTLLSHKMAEEIEKLFKEMKGLIKINRDSRDKGKNKVRIDSFKDKLGTTMKFWPRDALTRISNEEDKLFLLSMMGDREACMAEEDKVLSSREKRFAERRHAEEQRRGKEKVRKSNTEVNLSGETESEEEDHAPAQDPDFLATTPSSSRSHKK